ncbi:hypothetical protein BH24ACI4_BH24ACI4_27560 [soil metagenome]
MRTVRRTRLPALIACLALLAAASQARAEVLIRWNSDHLPSPQTLGVAALVVPAGNSTAVREARRLGYHVHLEVDAPSLGTFTPPPGSLAGVVLKGTASPEGIARLRRQLAPRDVALRTLDDRGKWPHIRTNWVTRNKEVLQVAGRSAQPWIENNAALMRIISAERPDPPQMVTYAWSPLTVADVDAGPALEDYLVAIAEAGSFGGDLVLPLHERLQAGLAVGAPQARIEWEEIRRYLDFYAWAPIARYSPRANIAVVTADPMRWFEVMNLLLRHNLPFELIPPSRLSAAGLTAMALAIVLDPIEGSPRETLRDFARSGGTVVLDAARAPSFAPPPGSVQSEDGPQRVYPLGKGRVMGVLQGVPDPNAFALEIRQALGREGRVIDIWNGITVLTAAYEESETGSTLVTVLNYAHQPLPVQIRIRGTFTVVHYESPEEPLALIPHEHRNGDTEFVLPALRAGGRVFLSGALP